MKEEFSLRFRREADLIHEEAEEFRQLSASDRFLAILDLMAFGEAVGAASPHRGAAERQYEAEEQDWQRFHKELFARHGF